MAGAAAEAEEVRMMIGRSGSGDNSKRRGLLRKRILNATDLRAMAGTAGLSASAAESLNQVLKSSK